MAKSIVGWAITEAEAIELALTELELRHPIAIVAVAMQFAHCVRPN
jgi:hypothetical protein